MGLTADKFAWAGIANAAAVARTAAVVMAVRARMRAMRPGASVLLDMCVGLPRAVVSTHSPPNARCAPEHNAQASCANRHERAWSRRSDGPPGRSTGRARGARAKDQRRQKAEGAGF